MTSFSFPPVSRLHSVERWPAVAMVTQHPVPLLRNNVNWWQRGGSAQPGRRGAPSAGEGGRVRRREGAGELDHRLRVVLPACRD